MAPGHVEKVDADRACGDKSFVAERQGPASAGPCRRRPRERPRPAGRRRPRSRLGLHRGRRPRGAPFGVGAGPGAPHPPGPHDRRRGGRGLPGTRADLRRHPRPRLRRPVRLRGECRRQRGRLGPHPLRGRPARPRDAPGLRPRAAGRPARRGLQPRRLGRLRAGDGGGARLPWPSAAAPTPCLPTPHPRGCGTRGQAGVSAARPRRASAPQGAPRTRRCRRGPRPRAGRRGPRGPRARSGA